MTDRTATDGTTELPDFICVDYGTKQLMVPWKPLIEALSKATPAQQEAVRCAVATGGVVKMILRLESERDTALFAQQSAERELGGMRRAVDAAKALVDSYRGGNNFVGLHEDELIRAVDALRALDAVSEGEKTHVDMPERIRADSGETRFPNDHVVYLPCRHCGGEIQQHSQITGWRIDGDGKLAAAEAKNAELEKRLAREQKRGQFDYEQAEKARIERDTAREELSALRAREADVARRQREACAEFIGDAGDSVAKHYAALARMAPLVTDEPPAAGKSENRTGLLGLHKSSPGDTTHIAHEIASWDSPPSDWAYVGGEEPRVGDTIALVDNPDRVHVVTRIAGNRDWFPLRFYSEAKKSDDGNGAFPSACRLIARANPVVPPPEDPSAILVNALAGGSHGERSGCTCGDRDAHGAMVDCPVHGVKQPSERCPGCINGYIIRDRRSLRCPDCGGSGKKAPQP